MWQQYIKATETTPQTTPNSTFFIAFHIFVLGEHKDFRFGVEIDHSKSQPTEDKLSLTGVWSHHVTHFKFIVSLKCVWSGLS